MRKPAYDVPFTRRNGARGAMVVLGALMASFLPARQAAAHAQMRRAAPPVGGVLSNPPTEVTLDFSEALEPRFSSIAVRDAAGTRMDKGDLQSGQNDPKRLVIGLSPLPPGTYKVIWQATSVDTHRTEGSYSFSIQP
jgi:methionine-rich copper-binding protein CopC